MSNSLRDRCASVLVSVTYLTPLVSSAPLPLRCCNVRQTFVERSSCSSPSYTSARTWRACAPAVGNGHKGSVCLSRYPFTSCTSNTLDSAMSTPAQVVKLRAILATALPGLQLPALPAVSNTIWNKHASFVGAQHHAFQRPVDSQDNDYERLEVRSGRT